MFLMRDETRTARKFYRCNASDVWINDGRPNDEVDPDDRLILEGAAADKWQIKPGQQYRYVVVRDGRKLQVFRSRLDMDNLCQKHELYEDQ